MLHTISITHPSGLIERELTNYAITLGDAVDIGMVMLRGYTADPEKDIHLLYTIKDEEGMLHYTSPTYTTITHQCGSRQFMVVDRRHTCTWCDEVVGEEDTTTKWTPTYDDRWGLLIES